MNARIRELREALPADAPVLSQLARRSKAHWGYSRAFMSACEAELTYACEDIAEQAFFVLQDGERIAGFYALYRNSDTQAELEALFVEPECIGTGCGRELIEHAKSTAAARGFRELIIQGDPNAARFYEAAGGLQIGAQESGSIPGRFLPLFRILLDESGE